MLIHEEDVRREQPVDDRQEAEETVVAEAQSEDAAITEQPEPTKPAPPITGRFLFVNVAGQRAKQLRLGAIARLEPDDAERLSSSKAERVAMEEVRRRLVHWELPEWHSVTASEGETPSKGRRARKQQAEHEA